MWKKAKKNLNKLKDISSRNAKWECNKSYSKLVDLSYKEFEKKISRLKGYKFPFKTNDIINIDKLEKNICIRNLMEKYILECAKEKNNYKGKESPSLEYLQQCRIFYKFKDNNLLRKAMTFKSKNYSLSQNYEKLEFLGDSIVESFISQCTFCLFSHYLFRDKDDEESVKNNKKREIKRRWRKRKNFGKKDHGTGTVSPYYMNDFYYILPLTIVPFPSFNPFFHSPS